MPLVQREYFYREFKGIPFSLRFLERETDIPMPVYDETTQQHDLSQGDRAFLANVTTTAKPNQRDTA